MSVPVGALTPAFRAELLGFYGQHFGWSEIEQLRLPDRVTIAIGGRDYLNVRERETAMACTGYEHLGLRLASTHDVEEAWAALDGNRRDVELQPLDRGDDGYRSFRFRYLLPLTIEVQYIPQLDTIDR
jgi:hypothetical protein